MNAIERETVLLPDVIAENVVNEVSHFTRSELGGDYTNRLVEKAEKIYSKDRQFTRLLKREAGRDYLYMFMRHWLASWLKREQRALFNKLPESFGMGKKLTSTCNAGS